MCQLGGKMGRTETHGSIDRLVEQSSIDRLPWDVFAMLTLESGQASPSSTGSHHTSSHASS